VILTNGHSMTCRCWMASHAATMGVPVNIWFWMHFPFLRLPVLVMPKIPWWSQSFLLNFL